MNQLVMAMFLMFVRVWTQHGLTDNDLLKDLTTVFSVFNAIFVLGRFVLLFFILNHFTWSVFQVVSKQTNLYIVPNITKGFFLPIVPFANGYNDICSERQTKKKNRLTSQQKKIAFKSNQTSLLRHCKVTLVQLIWFGNQIKW
jgi:hypothetical protein